MGKVCSTETMDEQIAQPSSRATQELRVADTEETKESSQEILVADELQPPLARQLAVIIAPSQAVLTNATLLQHIVDFQDGLPGLLRDLKRKTRSHGGQEYSIVSAAAKRQSVRAFEMIESFRQLPQHASRRDLEYSRAAHDACYVGAGAVLRWIMACPTVAHRLKRSELKSLWSPAVSYFKPGNFSVLEVLSEYFTPGQVEKLNARETWSNIKDVELLQWLTERYTISVPDDVFTQALYRKDDALVDYWISHRSESLPKRTLSTALSSGSWRLAMQLILNKQRVPDQKERMDLIMDAVKQQNLTLLKALHMYKSQYPFKKKPVEALELAASCGHVELVDELYLHHDDIISERAYALAATNGHVPVLEFMYSRSGIEGVPEAMDGAAMNGHMDCVRFLQEKRFFLATTKAMDGAATNGHLNVVKFLHENRTEGCTAQALAGAAENGHDDVVQWLLENRSEVRCAAGLDGLLLAGRAGDWLFYREEWKLFNNDAVDGSEHMSELMYEAGRKGKMAAVRFIVKTLHREDLLGRAYEGAAEIGSIRWLFAIHALDSTKQRRVPSSAIMRLVAAEAEAFRFATLGLERADALKWMVMQCEDKDEFSAMRDALAALKASIGDKTDYYYYHGEINLILELSRWAERRQPTPKEMTLLRQKYTTGIFSFASRGSAGDWVVEETVKLLLPRFKDWNEGRTALEFARKEDDPWLLGVWTLPKRAVVRNDLTVLMWCRELSEDPNCTEAGDFSVDESVLRAAIATGRLDLVKWCLSICDLDALGGADLFHDAVKYGQVEVAEWLLATHPQFCTDLSADRFDVWALHADARIFDWFDHLEQDHPELVKHVQPLYIAHSLASDDKVELLERLINTHPQLRSHLPDILNFAGYGGSLRTAEFLCGEMEKLFSVDGGPIVIEEAQHYEVEKTAAYAARDGKLEIVQLLCTKFPSVNFYKALSEAGERGQTRVVQYLLKNHFPTHGDAYEIRHSLLGYVCRTYGAQYL